MKNLLKKTPILGTIAKKVLRAIKPVKPFTNSTSYWIERYKDGGNSGDGSYGVLAEFKAEILNEFVQHNGIERVMEFGCGDGNQLKLARYPHYIGFDVSPEAISLCEKMFSRDPSKEFYLVGNFQGQRADLCLSLDVIYHLIEDQIFTEYMNRLFDSSERFVIVYASDSENNDGLAPHVRNRPFTSWVRQHKKDWQLRKKIANRYPASSGHKIGSISDFFVYEKIA